MKDYKKNGNQVIVRGSGNYSSDEAKEIARLKRELRDTQDALNVLKKQSAYSANNGSSPLPKREGIQTRTPKWLDSGYTEEIGEERFRLLQAYKTKAIQNEAETREDKK